jgi:hypothetical protein
MRDNVRWRYGDTNPVVAAVDSATVIEFGDLVYQDVDNAKPASSQADQGGETANQELFADNFLGVAMQRSRLGDTDPIRVAATGVFVFDCPPSMFELGDLFGPVINDAGKLQNQTVGLVPHPRKAIGRCAKPSNAGQRHEVLVDVRSTVMTGGVKGSIEAP